MLDIQEGDILVVAGVEYPIRVSAEWSSHGFRSSQGMRRVTNVAAATKRPAPLTQGVRGQPAIFLDQLWITPLDPVSPELKERLRLNTPHTLLECYTLDSGRFWHLVVEELRQ